MRRLVLSATLLFACSLASTGRAQGLSPHLREGWALLQQQDPGAIEVFEQLVRADPEDGEAWYCLGLARHGQGQLHEGLRGHLLATQLLTPGHPFRINATYNLACAYALLERPERSLRWLHRARNLGFRNPQLLASDTDLDSLREDPRFQAFAASPQIAAPAVGAAEVSAVTEVLPGGTGGVELGPDGVLYAADFGNRVFRIQPDGEWELFSEGYTKAADCTLDAEGHLLQVDFGAAKVWRIAPDGTRVDLAVQNIGAPVGIAVASLDEVEAGFFVTDFNKREIAHVSPDGSTRVVTRRGLLNGPNGLAMTELGLFAVNYSDGAVIQIDPATGAQRFVAELPGNGNGHVAWSGEALYVTGRKDHRIYRVTPAGGVSRVAGSGAQGTQDGDGAQASFSLPNGIALSADGQSLFVNDNLGGGRGGVVRRIRLAAD